MQARELSKSSSTQELARDSSRCLVSFYADRLGKRILFNPEAGPLGCEVVFKTSFRSTDTIYARVFFDRPVKEVFQLRQADYEIFDPR
jgi:hypothetical protein